MNEVSSQHSWGFSKGIRAAGQQTAFPLESDQSCRRCQDDVLTVYPGSPLSLALSGAWLSSPPCQRSPVGAQEPQLAHGGPAPRFPRHTALLSSLHPCYRDISPLRSFRTARKQGRWFVCLFFNHLFQDGCTCVVRGDSECLGSHLQR